MGFGGRRRGRTRRRNGGQADSAERGCITHMYIAMASGVDGVQLLFEGSREGKGDGTASQGTTCRKNSARERGMKGETHSATLASALRHLVNIHMYVHSIPCHACTYPADWKRAHCAAFCWRACVRAFSLLSLCLLLSCRCDASHRPTSRNYCASHRTHACASLLLHARCASFRCAPHTRPEKKLVLTRRERETGKGRRARETDATEVHHAAAAQRRRRRRRREKTHPANARRAGYMALCRIRRMNCVHVCPAGLPALCLALRRFILGRAPHKHVERTREQVRNAAIRASTQETRRDEGTVASSRTALSMFRSRPPLPLSLSLSAHPPLWQHEPQSPAR
ncbi:hypothetical protein MPH_07249 [Macrophomina phaseolina MS6]|uniref:Uncharacterized protein n=1 Tax=Macrophomina phaseolina (strain MS6) TaxID=1126212 RepID=K2RLM9_MACPH|nr:hypothetical protein MPH_07249 [Macrophomina phaseolina MS6]